MIRKFVGESGKSYIISSDATYRKLLEYKTEAILKESVGRVVSIKCLKEYYNGRRVRGIVITHKTGYVWVDTKSMYDPRFYPQFIMPSSIKPLSLRNQIVWKLSNM